MKYGMRERISGAVILLALAVIFIPMLFDDPPERDERPEPVLTIEQPIDIEHQPVDEPEPPASLSENLAPQPPPQSQSEPPAQPEAEPEPESEPAPALDPIPQVEPESSPEEAPEPQQDAQQTDPIAELTSEAEQPSEMPPVVENGDWAVQVGSFGEPGNAERLEKQLDDQGFTAYRRPRDNDLTTVYVGPFGSSEAGEQARTVLKEKVNIQGLLIRIQEGE